MTKEPNFKVFGKAAKKKTTSKKSDQIIAPTGYKHLQVRLSAEDARRFRRAAEDRGFSVHAGLIESINKAMTDWGESPVTDQGSAGKARVG